MVCPVKTTFLVLTGAIIVILSVFDVEWSWRRPWLFTWKEKKGEWGTVCVL
jgi:hypothetical protein